jgi:hypothetical protein
LPFAQILLPQVTGIKIAEADAVSYRSCVTIRWLVGISDDSGRAKYDIFVQE